MLQKIYTYESMHFLLSTEIVIGEKNLFLHTPEENVIFVEDLNWGRWWDAKSREGKSSSSEPKLGFQHTKKVLNLGKALKK